jgi:hypothetical protein
MENRNLQFLIILLAFVVMLPFLQLTRTSYVIMTIFLSLVLFFGVLASGTAKHISKTSIILGCSSLLCLWAEFFNSNLLTVWFAKVVFCLFFLYVAIVMLGKVIFNNIITANIIYGSACIYIIFGFIWAFLYSLVEYQHPGSFRFPDSGNLSVSQSYEQSLFDCFYFSFVTLTTLGYGDITPISKVAKMLVMLEGLIGQLYITMLVARLVGLYTARESQIMHASNNSGNK